MEGKVIPHKKKVRNISGDNNLTVDTFIMLSFYIWQACWKHYQLQFDTILVAKDPKLTNFDDDLHENISFQKSHFFLLQIIEWLINTDTYARESPAVQRMAISVLNYPRSMH